MLKKSLSIACAVSGGVDSCAAAIILKQKGFNVIGVFMNNWIDDDTNCVNHEHIDDAKYVCNKLNIEFKEINFVANYWNDVFSELINGYTNGRTPNPDVLCNRHIKFGAFLDYALNKLKVDSIAMGHYAGSSYGCLWEHFDDRPVKLLKAKDIRKDQTLFLSQIKQNSLKKVLFPLQNLTKTEVRKIAIDNGFANIARKPESTGICFIGKRNFKSFIEQFVEPKPGNFIDIDTGKVIGVHNGFHYWTIGECCKIGGLPKKYFIAEKIEGTNDMFVVSNTDHPYLYSDSVITENPHWICAEPIELANNDRFECEFRFQHVEVPEPCVVTKRSNHYLHITLSKPKRALTPGQFAALYKNNECLGSSVISKVSSLYHKYKNINKSFYKNFLKL